MYNWRKFNKDQKKEILKLRKLSGQPWHSPPHSLEKSWYHITAACYEHTPIIGLTEDRMADFEEVLIQAVRAESDELLAWCILPNQYHLLVRCDDMRLVKKVIGTIHGRTSFRWNRTDNQRGRKVWHSCLPGELRSVRHKWATLNYIHHNPVHHGYVMKWQDWPFSSAISYLETVGYDMAKKRWNQYPILDYGKGWDDPGI